MMCEYPALPVVDDNLNVIRIVSAVEYTRALKGKKIVREFSAESLMACGHAATRGLAAHRGHAGRTPR